MLRVISVLTNRNSEARRLKHLIYSAYGMYAFTRKGIFLIWLCGVFGGLCFGVTFGAAYL